MSRFPALAILALSLFAATAGAQTVTPKAYAPEDLRQLDERDQIRVIAREYGDQANGREIPDDQLEFYLDQIDSGWTFSRIKEDIAVSLRGDGRPGNGGWNGNNGNHNGWNNGNHNGWNNGNHNGWNNGYSGNWNNGQGGTYVLTGRSVRCESVNERSRQCVTNFRGRAVVARNLSRTRCVEGGNWGQREGQIWVSRGCRADFAEVRGDGRWGNGDYARYSVSCASPNDRYTTCAWNNRWGRPELAERTSRAECIEGRSWGYRNGAVWVDRGCRARFVPDVN